jgi:hypothetical protein
LENLSTINSEHTPERLEIPDIRQEVLALYATSREFRQELINHEFPIRETLSLNDLQEDNTSHAGIEYLRSHPRSDPLDLVEKAYEFQFEAEVSHRFNSLQNVDIYSRGALMCAYYVSTILGLGEANDSNQNKIGSVRNLIPFLINQNLEYTGSTGIVNGPGFQNIIRGDVLCYLNYSDPENNRLGHVAIVRERFEFQGEEYLCIQHSTTRGDSGFIQTVFLPVNPTSDINALEEEWNTHSSLDIFHEIRNDRGEFSNERNRVIFINQSSASSTRGNQLHHLPIENGGDVAFAIRTSSLINRSYDTLMAQN